LKLSVTTGFSDDESEDGDEDDQDGQSPVNDTQSSIMGTAGAVIGGLAAGAVAIPVVGNALGAVLGALATVLKAGHIDEITRTKCREVQCYLQALSDCLSDDLNFGQILHYRKKVEDKFKELELIVATILHRDGFDRATGSLSTVDLEKIDAILTDLNRLRNEEMHEKGNLILQKLDLIHGSLLQAGTLKMPTDEQRELLNFLRFATVLVDELPKSLRLFLQKRWALKYPDQPWNGKTCWDGSPLDVRLDLPVQCFVPQSKTNRWCKLRSASPLKEWLAEGDQVEIQLENGDTQSGLFVISIGTTKSGDGDFSVATLNKLDKFDGQAKIFTQRIKHERKAPTQMKEPFARNMRANNIDKWDISLLMFLLCNSSHMLLDNNDPKDCECLKLLLDLRLLRNAGFGHAVTCRLSDADLAHNISIVMKFAESEFNDGDDLKARIEKVKATDFPVDTLKPEIGGVLALQGWETQFSEVWKRLDAGLARVGAQVAEVGEQVAEVGEQVAGVGGQVAGVSEQVAGVDAKLDELDEKIDAVLNLQREKVSDEDKELGREILSILESASDCFEDGKQCLRENSNNPSLPNLLRACGCFKNIIDSNENTPNVVEQATMLFVLVSFRLGMRYLGDKRYDKAVQCLNDALTYRPSDVPQDRERKLREYHACCLYYSGIQHFNRGDWGTAFARFDAADETGSLPSEQQEKNIVNLDRCKAKRAIARELKNFDQRTVKVPSNTVDDEEQQALSRYKEAKEQLRNGNTMHARELFKEANNMNALPPDLKVRADEYVYKIEGLRDHEIEKLRTSCVFENTTHNLTLGFTVAHLLSTTKVSAFPKVSSPLSMVLDLKFPPNSVARSALILRLRADVRKALGELADMNIKGTAHGSIIVIFCFVPHQTQTIEDVRALEAEYLKQVLDKQSELRSGELTCSIDAERTLQMTTQLGESANQQRPCPYQKGDTISFSSLGEHKKSSKIESVLGEGASATVFKVKLHADGRRCALKVFRTEKHLLELSQEASLLLTLNHPRSHPNVIGIDFVWFEQRTREMFFLMEFVGGGTLQDWMDDERLYVGSEQEQQQLLLGVAHQLACGVQHLHSLGILHSDVKPANVLMTEEGRPVLADVGVSSKGEGESGRIEARLKGASPAFSSPHVRALIVKVKYEVPVSERARFLEESKITHLDDIWCIAATIFCMFAISGWRKGRSVAEIWYDPVEFAIELRVPTSKGLRKVLDQCFSAAGTAERVGGSSSSTLTMGTIVDEIGSLVSELAPPLKPGLSDKHCSIIHNNLGLGLHKSDHLFEASVHYERAIQVDASSAQMLEFNVVDADGKAFALAEDLESLGGIDTLRQTVQEKLNQVLGVEDHPLGCTVHVEGDTITVHIIRAAMWDQMTKDAGVGVLTDVGFLHALRDQVLGGDFERDFTQKSVGPHVWSLLRAHAEEQATEAEQQVSATMRRREQQTLQTSANRRHWEDVVRRQKISKTLSNELARVAAMSKKLGAIKFKANLTAFAVMYERSVRLFKSLTPHQAEKLRECYCYNEGALLPPLDIHIQAPAGGGKTFLGMHMADNLLDNDPNATILFAATNLALAVFFVNWICTRRDQPEDIEDVLQRLHVLTCTEDDQSTALPKKGPAAFEDAMVLQFKCCDGLLKTFRVDNDTLEYSLLIVDEAHHIYCDTSATSLRHSIERYTCANTRRVLLSDVSQSTQAEMEYPLGRMAPVVLHEVVRSSRRIVEGARIFQTNDDEAPSQCHQNLTAGPPLTSFLFDRVSCPSQRAALIGNNLVFALKHVSKQFPGLSLHNRVAIIVPDEHSARQLVKSDVCHRIQQFCGKCKFVNAATANRVIVRGGEETHKEPAEQWLVLDTVDNFNGLERLIVIAVAQDSPIPTGFHVTNSEHASLTRSQVYRAITRAHMMVVVVNEVRHGGWLEFLTHVEFDEESQFENELETKWDVKGKARATLNKHADSLLANSPVVAVDRAALAGSAAGVAAAGGAAPAAATSAAGSAAGSAAAFAAAATTGATSATGSTAAAQHQAPVTAAAVAAAAVAAVAAVAAAQQQAAGAATVAAATVAAGAAGAAAGATCSSATVAVGVGIRLGGMSAAGVTAAPVVYPARSAQQQAAGAATVAVGVPGATAAAAVAYPAIMRICRVKDCFDFGKPHDDTPGGGGGHYCSRCGDLDADHRARACPDAGPSKAKPAQQSVAAVYPVGVATATSVAVTSVAAVGGASVGVVGAAGAARTAAASAAARKIRVSVWDTSYVGSEIIGRTIAEIAADGFMPLRAAESSSGDVATCAVLSHWVYGLGENAPTEKSPPPSCDGVDLPEGMEVIYTQWANNTIGGQGAIQCAILKHRQTQYLVFRGTRDPFDLNVDFNVGSKHNIHVGLALVPMMAAHGLIVHSGLLARLQDISLSRISIIDRLANFLVKGDLNSIVICGHSWGGGYATIAAAHLLALGLPVSKVFTYGSPFVLGSDQEQHPIWQQLHERTTGLVYNCDIVPRTLSPTAASWIFQFLPNCPLNTKSAVSVPLTTTVPISGMAADYTVPISGMINVVGSMINGIGGMLGMTAGDDVKVKAQISGMVDQLTRIKETVCTFYPCGTTVLVGHQFKSKRTSFLDQGLKVECERSVGTAVIEYRRYGAVHLISTVDTVRSSSPDATIRMLGLMCDNPTQQGIDSITNDHGTQNYVLCATILSPESAAMPSSK
jgi:serine/threonine protein kinase/tetratricopeptide (TPR) repeat protein